MLRVYVFNLNFLGETIIPKVFGAVAEGFGQAVEMVEKDVKDIPHSLPMLVTSFITTARWGEVVDLMPEDTDWVAEDAG